MTDYENYNQNEYTQPEPKKQKNGVATASLACRVCALLELCCCTFPLAVIMGMDAIAFAIVSRKDQSMSGTAIAGIVLGVLAVALGVAEFFAFLYIYDLMREPELIPYFNEWFRQIQQVMAEQGYMLQ